jgi:hypothetical protein
MTPHLLFVIVSNDFLISVIIIYKYINLYNKPAVLKTLQSHKATITKILK